MRVSSKEFRTQASTTAPVPEVSPRRAISWSRSAGLVLIALLAGVVVLMSLGIGSLNVSMSDTIAALTDYDPASYDQSVVRSLRLPRTLIGIGVGAALAVSGTVMQAATRNPLADPSILGVSAGASLFVVTAIYFGGLTEPMQYIWFAFAGGMITSLVVYGIASVGAGGPTPVKLALAGVIVSALMGSWTSALLLTDRETMDVVRHWEAGAIVGRSMEVFWTVLPFLGGGVLASIFTAHQLNVLALGDDIARALGMRTGLVRGSLAVIVVLMTGASVAAAGPIGFVGLAVPHMLRPFVGGDYRWLVPYSLFGGIVLLLGSDILGRVIMRPAEVQVGIVTAALGAPFLIWIARRARVAEL